MTSEDKKVLPLTSQEEVKNWFDSMRTDIAYKIRQESGVIPLSQIEETDRAMVKLHATHIKTGFFSIVPMRCPGKDTCQMSETCPLAAMNKEPQGESCPIEKEVLINNTMGYIQEYQVDPIKEYGKYTLILSLARYDIFLNRALAFLNDFEQGKVMQEYVIGVDPEGTPVTTKDVNRAFTAVKMFEDQRLRIIKELVGTSKEQYKREAALKIAEQNPSVASYLTKVKQSVDTLYAGLQQGKKRSLEPVIDVKPAEGE